MRDKIAWFYVGTCAHDVIWFVSVEWTDDTPKMKRDTKKSVAEIVMSGRTVSRLTQAEYDAKCALRPFGKCDQCAAIKSARTSEGQKL